MDERLRELHDGKLLGINLGCDNCAELVATSPGGAEWRFGLSGVQHLIVNNFREGNIILDITIEPASRVEPVRLESFRFDGQKSDHVAEMAQILHNEAIRKGLFFFELTSSYGCYIAGLVEKVSLEQQSVGTKDAVGG
jgi:hypothetical protein